MTDLRSHCPDCGATECTCAPPVRLEALRVEGWKLERDTLNGRGRFRLERSQTPSRAHCGVTIYSDGAVCVMRNNTFGAHLQPFRKPAGDDGLTRAQWEKVFTWAERLATLAGEILE